MTPDRLFTLLVVLESGRPVTTRDLAEQTGVSTRTVLRDLRWLNDAGFPVYVERGRYGGISYLPGRGIDVARLTPEEIDRLSVGGLDGAQRERLDGSSADRVTDKLARRARGSSDDLLPLRDVVTVDNRGWFATEPAGTSPAALVEPLRRRRRLRIRYRHSGARRPTWYTVDPYGLFAKAGRWYLVADRSAAPNLYALERIEAWQDLARPRVLRPGATLRSVARDLTSSWEDSRDVTVHGELDAGSVDRARRILGNRLSVTGRPGRTGADRITITVACQEIEDVRQLLQFAEHLEITGPPQARQRIRDLATEIAEIYQSAPAGRP